MNNQNNRNLELDTIKFLAIFIVYIQHFISSYRAEYLSIWSMFPANIILYGVTGKMGVAFFGTLLAYFACSRSKRNSLLEYSLKRYGYFACVGIFINTIYCFWQGIPLSSMLSVSLSIGSDIFPTYWCMRDFLFASVIAYYIGKYNWNFERKAIFILLLFILGQLWVPICLLGTLISDLTESRLFQNKYFCLLMFLVSFVSVKRSEDTLTYILDGVFAVIVISIVENSNSIKRILSNKITAFFGKRTMAIYVLHPITYSILGQWLFNNYFHDFGLDFVLVMAICFLAVCALAFPVNLLFDMCNKALEKFSAFCKGKLL